MVSPELQKLLNNGPHLTYEELRALPEGTVLIGCLWVSPIEKSENTIGLFTVGEKTGEDVSLHYLQLANCSRLKALVRRVTMGRRRLIPLWPKAE